jgi:hypothetical protein
MKMKGTLMNKAPLVNYATETERRRSTLTSRLGTATQFLSDDQVIDVLRSEDPERIPELLVTAARLSRDQRLAISAVAKAGSSGITIPNDLAAQAEVFFKVEYGIKTDFSGLIIPAPPIGRTALFLAMHEKVSSSPEFLFQSDKKAYGGKAWKYTDRSLDEAVPTHQLTGTFGVWVAEAQQAPDGCVGGINLSTKAVDELDWITETLPMRQVHGRKFFREHGEHLDTKVVTLCPGSRIDDGFVPGMRLDGGGRVGVDDWYPGGASGGIRFRRAVSL